MSRASSASLLAVALLLAPSALIAQDPAPAPANVVTIRFQQIVERGYSLLRPTEGTVNTLQALRVPDNATRLDLKYRGKLIRLNLVIKQNSHTFMIGPRFQGDQVIGYRKVLHTGCDEENEISKYYGATDNDSIELNALIELETWWNGLCRPDDPEVRSTRARIKYHYCRRKDALVRRYILKWGGEPPGLSEANCRQALNNPPPPMA